MKLVYENWHRELLFSRPLARGSFVSVQGHSDNRETRVLQFVSELLPNWQLVAAASPRRPSQQQSLATVEITERYLFAMNIRQYEIWCIKAGH